MFAIRSVALAIAVLLATPAGSQEFADKTVLWSFNGASGQIFIARSGTIYYIFGRRAAGINYRLGRTIRGPKAGPDGCNSQMTAAQTGTTLVLDQVLDCASVQSTSHIVVTIDGSNCRLVNTMTGSGLSGPSTFAAETCTVVSGNRLSQ